MIGGSVAVGIVNDSSGEKMSDKPEVVELCNSIDDSFCIDHSVSSAVSEHFPSSALSEHSSSSTFSEHSSSSTFSEHSSSSTFSEHSSSSTFSEHSSSSTFSEHSHRNPLKAIYCRKNRFQNSPSSGLSMHSLSSARSEHSLSSTNILPTSHMGWESSGGRNQYQMKNLASMSSQNQYDHHGYSYKKSSLSSSAKPLNYDTQQSSLITDLNTLPLSYFITSRAGQYQYEGHIYPDVISSPYSKTRTTWDQISPNTKQHIVNFHVNQGEAISIQLEEQVQLIPGPAIVKMVSFYHEPPVPIPMQVPPGHTVQQLVDEHGVLQHVFLTPMSTLVVAAPPVVTPNLIETYYSQYCGIDYSAQNTYWGLPPSPPSITNFYMPLTPPSITNFCMPSISMQNSIFTQNYKTSKDISWRIEDQHSTEETSNIGFITTEPEVFEKPVIVTKDGPGRDKTNSSEADSSQTTQGQNCYDNNTHNENMDNEEKSTRKTREEEYVNECEKHSKHNTDVSTCITSMKMSPNTEMTQMFSQVDHAANIIFGIFDKSPLRMITLAKKGNKKIKTLSYDEVERQINRELEHKLNLLQVTKENQETKKIDQNLNILKLIIGINFNDILNALLPRYATSLIDSINLLFSDDLSHIALAVLQIIQTYSRRQYTHITALKEAIRDIGLNGKISNNSCGIRSLDSMTDCVHEPLVIFDIKLWKSVPKTEEEKCQLENKIQDTLNQINTDIILQEWILQEHKKKIKVLGRVDVEHDYIHNHTHCDNVFSHMKANLVEVFYGSLHASIKFTFDIEDGINQNETFLNKMNNLEELCHIALENLEIIFPHSEKKKPIKVCNSTIEVDYDDGKETAETVVLENLREVYGTLYNNKTSRELLLSKLHEKNVTQYNTTRDILNLLSTEDFTNVDKLQIKMAGTFTQKNKVNKIDASYTLWPGRTRPLAHMNDSDIAEIHFYFKKCLKNKYISPLANYLIHNMSVFKNNIKLLGKILKNIEMTNIQLEILLAIKDNGGKVGDVIDVLSGFNSSNYDINLSKEENEDMEMGIHDLLKQLEDWIQTTFRQWKEKYNIKLPSNILTRTEFEQFVCLEYRDIFQIPGMDRKAFLQKVNEGEVLIGDQVWTKRHTYHTGMYAHVGVYVGKDNEDGLHKIVHAQPSTIPSEAQVILEIIDNVFKEDDNIFVVRYRHKLETPYSSEQIKQRALICCEEPRLTFKYSGYYGSCETVASLICGTRSIKDLNLQGFKIAFSEGLNRKKGIANTLEGIHSYTPSVMQPYFSEDLLAAFHKRFNQRSSINKLIEANPQPANSVQLTLSSHHTNGTMDLEQFLESISLSHLETSFNKEDVDFKMLLTLSENDLEKIGISSFGQRRKLTTAIKQYKETLETSSAYSSCNSPSQRSSSSEDSETMVIPELETN